MQNKGEHPVLKSIMDDTVLSSGYRKSGMCEQQEQSNQEKSSQVQVLENFYTGIVEFSCRRRGFSGVTVFIPALGILEIVEYNHALTPPPLASAGSAELAASCNPKENPRVINCFQNRQFREMLRQNLVLTVFPSALFEDPPQRQCE